MRLIDADELKKCAIPCEIQNGALTDLCVPLYQIDNAPTVELHMGRMTNGIIIPIERPQGKWIKEVSKSLEGMYRCSVCGRRVEDLTDDLRIHAGLEDSTVADIYPFCHCGADMRGGKK